MGTGRRVKPEGRDDFDVEAEVFGNRGLVAQVLHPQWMRRTDIRQIGRILKEVSEKVSAQSSDVRLIVTGGGFIEIEHNKTYSARSWRSEQVLNEITGVVQATMRPVAALVSDSLDYVIGVDVTGNAGCSGQFAVLLKAGKVAGVAWKTYPTSAESTHLAGFGTEEGRNSPRVVSTSLGKTLLLVCHDAQAYSDLRRKATERRRVNAKQTMRSLAEAEHPTWALSMIHSIAVRRQATNPFRISYKKLHDSYGVSNVVGAFGYQKEAEGDLQTLAGLTQYPEGTSEVVVALRPSH